MRRLLTLALFLTLLLQGWLPRTDAASATASAEVRVTVAAAPATSAPAQRVGHRTLRVTPRRPLRGEKVRIASRVAGPKRSVRLQIQNGGRWTTLRTARSRGGHVAFSYGFSRSPKLRIVAPAIIRRHHRVPAFHSRSLRLQLVPQGALLDLEDAAYVQEQVTAHASFTPSRPGRTVVFQGSDGGRWRTVQVASEDSSGSATFTLAGVEPGDFQYRVTALALNGARPVSSATHQMRILPSEISLSPDAHVLSSNEADSLTEADPESGELSFEGTDTPNVAPGQFLPLPPSQPLPSGGLFRVDGVSHIGDTTVVSTQPASLPEIVENVPPDFNGFAPVVTGTSVDDLPPGTVLESIPRVGHRRPPSGPDAVAGMAGVDLPEIRLRFDQSLQVGNDALSVNGYVHFRPGMRFGYHAKLFRPGDWNVGLTYTYDVSLHAQYEAKALEGEFSIGRVTRGFLFFVGPVPVFLTAEFGPTISLETEAGVGVKSELQVQGSRGFGIKRSDGKIGFYDEGNDVARTSFSPFLAGEARLFGGFKGEVDAYGIAGPSFKGGYELVGQAQVDSGGFSCEIYHRPVIEVGVKTSELMEKLFDQKFTSSFGPDFRKRFLYECATNPPSIATTSLMDAAVGTPYTFRLTTEDGREGTWALFGDHPAWLLVDADTGTLEGVPLEGDEGTYSVGVRFTDGGGQSTESTLLLRVAPPSTCLNWLPDNDGLDIDTGDSVTLSRVSDGGPIGNDQTTDYGGTVSWGDGAVERIYEDAIFAHVYDSAGTFDLHIDADGLLYGSTYCADDVHYIVRVHPRRGEATSALPPASVGGRPGVAAHPAN